MFRKTLTAIAFTALTLGSAQALTIDDFSVAQTLSIPGAPTTVSGTVAGPTTSIVGGERESSLTKIAGSDPASLAFDSGSSGTMSIANGTGGTSNSTIFYDGVGSGGFSATDFTVGGTQDAFDLRVIANDFAALVTIDVASASGTSTLSLFSPGGIPGPASVPMLFEYSSFFGAADFTSLTSITLNVDTTFANATDIELDFFGTTTTEMPEPTALAIIGLGLAGLGFARRRRG